MYLLGLTERGRRRWSRLALEARRSLSISVLRATVIITLLLRVRALKLAISVLALLTSSLRGTGRVKNYGQARAVLLRVPHPIDVGNIKYICKNSG